MAVETRLGVLDTPKLWFAIGYFSGFVRKPGFLNKSREKLAQLGPGEVKNGK
jgi:hypothetical protein